MDSNDAKAKQATTCASYSLTQRSKTSNCLKVGKASGWRATQRYCHPVLKAKAVPVVRVVSERTRHERPFQNVEVLSATFGFPFVIPNAFESFQVLSKHGFQEVYGIELNKYVSFKISLAILKRVVEPMMK